MTNITHASPGTTLHTALAFALRGFRVFPCRPGGKEPLNGVMWKEQATVDPLWIQQWWQQCPEANLAIVADDLVILDVDRKPGKPSGFDTLKHLQPFPKTYTVSTPNKGLHLYFTKPDPKWSPGIRRGEGFDVQTGAAYVLAPPSRLEPMWDDKFYTVVDPGPIAVLPPNLAEFLGQASNKVYEVVDLPPMLDPSDTPKPDTMGWPEKVLKWWHQGDPSGYANDRSRAVQGLTLQLYLMGFNDTQVLSILANSGWNWDVATDRQHNSSQSPERAVQWLWQGCLKVREQRRPDAGEVFEQLTTTPTGEDAEGLYVRLYDAVQALKTPNTPETLRALTEILSAGLPLPEPARALLATAIGDKNLGMTRKQVENILFPRKSRRGPAGEGESGEWGLARITDHIWVGHLARFYNTKSGRFLTRDGFKGQYAHMVSEDQSPEDLVTAYLRQEKTKVEALTFRPEHEPGPMMEDRELKWNIGAPLALEPQEGDWQPYLDLFRYMGISDAERDHVLDYMAWMVQKPGERIRHALVIGGRGHGTGKDTLLVPLKLILGKRYVHELKGRNLNARFNSYLLNKRLILVQEAHQDDARAARSLENHLKPLFTSDEVEVEPKGVDMFMVRNYAHWVITTNEAHPLHISSGDRRYAMVKVTLEFESAGARDRWAPYWRQLYAWINGGGASYVLWHLQRRDLSHFDPNMAPLTTTWHEQIERSSLSEAEEIVLEAIEDQAGVMAWPFFTREHAWSSVRAAFPHSMAHGRPISQKEVVDALKHLGYFQDRLSFRFQGVVVHKRVWTKTVLKKDQGRAKQMWEEYMARIKQTPELQGSNVVDFPGAKE